MSDLINKAMVLSQIRGVEPGTAVNRSQASKGEKLGLSFEDILFSKHAEKRLQSRQIDLTQTEKTQLSGALENLEKKGARDSLVLMGELAFIVNIPSKTVVTALSRDQMKDQVFTNIDSTILV